MGRIHEIRLKSNAFCANINVNIAQSIESVSNELTGINKKQMLNHTDSEDKPLIHARTGSANLSKAYAQRQRKSKPDLFVDGTFQGQMFLSVDENRLSWFISSFWEKTKFLVGNYGAKIFGISEKSNDRAKYHTSLAFKKKYESEVLR